MIVGCGLAGFFLANALTKVNLRQQKEQQQYQHKHQYLKHKQQQSGKLPPPVPPPPLAVNRIVMVENCIWEKGHKKTYQRTWMTGTGPSSIWGAIDP